MSVLIKKKIDIFRINLSHTDISKILKTILFLKKNNVKNICIDTEGAQLRTYKVKKKFKLKLNKIIKLNVMQNTIKNKSISLYPKFNINTLKVGTKIKIGFEGLLLLVIKNFKNKNYVLAKVISSGLLEGNKGVHVNQNIKLPALTKKDIYGIKVAMQNGIKIFALSFANNVKNVQEIRNIIGKNSFLISKIETLNSVNNLSSICKASEAILIDRGDLSRYIPIEEIPAIQEKIIKKAKIIKTPVYVATNLLETMINNSQPTRAESNDIYSTLKQGASGLVLAAETAIGSNPISCVLFLKKCIKIFFKYKKINEN